MLWRLNRIATYSLLLGLCHCVGPTSPFGAIEDASSKSLRVPAQSVTTGYFQIEFHPQKQVYHDRSDFSFKVKSNTEIDNQTKVQVLHNGLDVTNSFLSRSHLHRSADNRTIIYTMKDLRLKTLDANKIKVRLIKESKVLAESEFEEPRCSLFAKRKLAHLGAFHVPLNYIEMIEKTTIKSQTNPLFLAGIVAQESGFNPKAVSWAKAIGLTQMTPVAEKEIMNQTQSEEWPRYPGINKLSYLTLKSKIYLGEIDHGKEWRLDPKLSLQGGMAYVNYLKKYWRMDKNIVVINKLEGDYDRIFTEVVLASYNSGASRVKRAIQEKGTDWKKHESLKEAAKYIKKVSSYCFHYGESEVSNDNET